MPRLLTLHIVRHVLAMTAIVGLAMMAIQSFVTLVTEADETGKGGFGLAELLLTTLYSMPAGLALLMPMVAMIGTLMGLGSLAQQGELTAMRAAGVSPLRLAFAVVLAGTLLATFGWWLNDVAAPAGARAADALKDRAEGRKAGGQKAWLRDGDAVLRIRDLAAEDRALGVEIYRLDERFRLRSALAAEEARWQDGAWQLSGVRETHFAADGSAVATRDGSAVYTGTVTPRVLRLILLEADAISVAGLGRLIAYLDENKLDALKYRYQLATRLIAPVTVVVMAFFAVPFAFGSLRDTGAGQRLLIGILLGIGFYVLNRVASSLGQLNGWPPWLAAAGPTALWAAAGAWRVLRLR